MSASVSVPRANPEGEWIMDWYERPESWDKLPEESPEFVPYEVLTTTDTETLMRQLTLRKMSLNLSVRGRDHPRQPWDPGLAVVDQATRVIAINYKSGDKEMIPLSNIKLNQKTDRHLIEIDARTVVRALHLYDGRNGIDEDWSFFAEHEDEFKKYIQELPTFFKYLGPNKIVDELRMLVQDMGDYYERNE